MEQSKVQARWCLQLHKASWPAVFLQGLHPELSSRRLQDHFTQFGIVLRIVRGSCGKCGLVFFASRAATRRVLRITQLVEGRELCPLLVDKVTAKHFWRSGDGRYPCDTCTPFAERDGEGRLFMENEEEEERKKEGNEEPRNKLVPECSLEAELLQRMQRERRSVMLLRHLKEQSARSLFSTEKKSFNLLQRLREMDSEALLLSGKEEASTRLLCYLRSWEGGEADGL